MSLTSQARWQRRKGRPQNVEIGPPSEKTPQLCHRGLWCRIFVSRCLWYWELLPCFAYISIYMNLYVCISDHACMHAQLLSRVWLFVTQWTVACQAPPSMKFFRQEYWSGLSFSPPGDPIDGNWVSSVRPHRQQPTRLSRPWDSPGKNTGVGCHFLLQCVKVKSQSEVSQSCLTPSDPMDCSLPGSSIHGTFPARVLEWVAIAFSVQLPTQPTQTWIGRQILYHWATWKAYIWLCLSCAYLY